MNRDEAIKRIRAGLKARSGKAWSVKGGRGTDWGWITIISPPRRCHSPWHMTDVERKELAKLLGFDSPIHFQGRKVPASVDYYIEYVARAEGRTPERYGEPYWD